MGKPLNGRVRLTKTVRKKPMTKNLHVVQNGKSWLVKAEKTTQPVSRHYTQENAIAKATAIAKTDHTEVIIHGRDGRIRERNSFGNDPFPPKG